MTQKVLIIGGGIGGLGTAALLAKEGLTVMLFEKNATLGGVCNRFDAEGFSFDTGPSWYMMPDVYRRFFELLGEDIDTRLDLVRLDPSYRIFFEGEESPIDISSDINRDLTTIERIAPAEGGAWRRYLDIAKKKYEASHAHFLHDNYDTLFDFVTWPIFRTLPMLGLHSNMDRELERRFVSDRLKKILHFPVTFLGAAPWKTPALFSFMNYIDFGQGIWYPKGGMYEIVRALIDIGLHHGASYRTDAPVARIITEGSRAVGVELQSGEVIHADLVISNVDVGFTETLLPPGARMQSEAYWNKRTASFGVMLLYLGVDGKISQLAHHNVLFSDQWRDQFRDIYEGNLSDIPSIYVGAPSVSDTSVAPPGKENLFVLVPIPARTDYLQGELSQYADMVLGRVEHQMKIPGLRSRVIYKKMFAAPDFARTYHTYRGSLGPAQTLFQSAWWRPNNIHAKIPNLYFVGASTNPGIGVPTCLISAERVWKRIVKNLDK